MESSQASLAVIGIDIGKKVFHIVGLGFDGKIAIRRKIRRLGLKDAFERLPPCIVAMDRARHCCQGRPAGPPQVAVRDTGKPEGRDLAPHRQPDPRSL